MELDQYEIGDRGRNHLNTRGNLLRHFKDSVITRIIETYQTDGEEVERVVKEEKIWRKSRTKNEGIIEREVVGNFVAYGSTFREVPRSQRLDYIIYKPSVEFEVTGFRKL